MPTGLGGEGPWQQLSGLQVPVKKGGGEENRTRRQGKKKKVESPSFNKKEDPGSASVGGES